MGLSGYHVHALSFYQVAFKLYFLGISHMLETLSYGDNYYYFYLMKDCDNPKTQWYYPHFTEFGELGELDQDTEHTGGTDRT